MRHRRLIRPDYPQPTRNQHAERIAVGSIVRDTLADGTGTADFGTVPGGYSVRWTSAIHSCLAPADEVAVDTEDEFLAAQHADIA